MTDIFSARDFVFPYTYKFPGQATQERIMYVTRENAVMLLVRRIGVIAAAVAVVISGWLFAGLASDILGPAAQASFQIASVVLSVTFAAIGWWWVTVLWKKSIAIVTTMRLIKFIYTTPFNRHNLSLPLDQIVDTGSYTKGFDQALFKLGTFTARSSASSSGAATDDPDRVNKKYFYIENIAVAEDLQHYVSKLLYAFRQHHQHLDTFRPFLPNLKGDARKKFMEQYPDFWS
jgi:hypothetical protein